MKFITDYKEFHESCTKSVLENIGKPILQKEKVLNYLKNGQDAGVRCSSVVDVVTGDYVPLTIHLYTDGEYKWTGSEIYNFEMYDVILDKDFLEKVLKAS